MRTKLFSFPLISLAVALCGCGGSDSSNDVGDTSVDDSAVADSAVHDSAVADSAHDTNVVDANDAPPTDAADASPDVVSDVVADSGAPDVEDTAVDSPAVDSTPADADAGKSCTSNADCASNEMCDAPTCSGPGTCVLKPSIGVFCKLDPDSSCGCDGKDYTSVCAAHKAGVRVAHYGACSTTGCTSNTDCTSLGADFYCSFGLGYCTIAGFCKSEAFCPSFLSPYCTCSGADVSTNGCLADKSGTRLAHAGSCP